MNKQALYKGSLTFATFLFRKARLNLIPSQVHQRPFRTCWHQEIFCHGLFLVLGFTWLLICCMVPHQWPSTNAPSILRSRPDSGSLSCVIRKSSIALDITKLLFQIWIYWKIRFHLLVTLVCANIGFRLRFSEKFCPKSPWIDTQENSAVDLR